MASVERVERGSESGIGSCSQGGAIEHAGQIRSAPGIDRGNSALVEVPEVDGIRIGGVGANDGGAQGGLRQQQGSGGNAGPCETGAKFPKRRTGFHGGGGALH